jgi:uncharacterized protein YndB with AHSA1/START domain
MTVKEKELVLTKVFNAPRERVWKAWTDPKQLAQWWGPAGLANLKTLAEKQAAAVRKAAM